MLKVRCKMFLKWDQSNIWWLNMDELKNMWRVHFSRLSELQKPQEAQELQISTAISPVVWCIFLLVRMTLSYVLDSEWCIFNLLRMSYISKCRELSGERNDLMSASINLLRLTLYEEKTRRIHSEWIVHKCIYLQLAANFTNSVGWVMPVIILLRL